MNNYITVFVNYIDSEHIDTLFELLYSLGTEYWYMYKKGKLRLRIQEGEKSKVIQALEKNKYKYNVGHYEAEMYLFGGEYSLESVHCFFCHVAAINMKLRKETQKDRDIVVLSLVNHIVNKAGFDYFEEWDVWKKVAAHRRINWEDSKEQVISILPAVYQIINVEINSLPFFHDQQNIYNLNRITDFIAEIIAVPEEKLERGERGILSAIIIFSFNMLEVDLQRQAGFVYALSILKNPDFREVFSK